MTTLTEEARALLAGVWTWNNPALSVAPRLLSKLCDEVERLTQERDALSAAEQLAAGWQALAEELRQYVRCTPSEEACCATGEPGQCPACRVLGQRGPGDALAAVLDPICARAERAEALAERAAAVARAERAERERDALAAQVAGFRVPLPYHRCSDGVVRPYPGGICSASPDCGERDFDVRVALAERDAAVARAERAERALLCERGDPVGAPEGWRCNGDEWEGPAGALVRLEGAEEAHGEPLWQWYADRDDEGDPAHVAPTALEAMEAADAAAKGESK